MKNIFRVLVLLLALAGIAHAQDRHIQYSGTSLNVTTSPFQSYSATSQVFIFANAPQNAISIYATNFGASAHSVTIATFSTGIPGVADFTNNVSAWSPLSTIIVATGTSSPSQTISIPAHSTFVLGTAIVSAAQIAIKVSAADASTDSFALNVILTPNGGLANNDIQGVVAQGAPGTTVNPVIIGGVNTLGNAQSYSLTDSGLLGRHVNGFPIGGNTIGAGNSIGNQLRLPAGSPDGPLGITEFLWNSGTLTPALGTGIDQSGASQTQSSNALLVANSGWFKNLGAQNVTTGTTFLTLWSDFDMPTVGLAACYVTSNTTFQSGTGTLNAFFQTSNDNTNFQDRIAFTTVTTASLNQIAGIGDGAGGLTPTIATDRALASGTKVDGPIGRFGRIVVVVGGAASYGILFGVSCR